MPLTRAVSWAKDFSGAGAAEIASAGLQGDRPIKNPDPQGLGWCGSGVYVCMSANRSGALRPGHWLSAIWLFPATMRGRWD